MKPITHTMDSWKMFWGLYGLLTVWMSIGTAVFIQARFPAAHQNLGPILFLGLVGSMGAVGLGLIHRSITGRNRAGVFFIMASVPAFLSGPNSLPLMEMVFQEFALMLVLAPFVAFFSTTERLRTRRKSRRKTSPLADPEIDARPLA